MKKIKIILPIIILVIAAYIIVLVISGNKNDDDQLVIQRKTTEEITSDEGSVSSSSDADAATDETTEDKSNAYTSTSGVVINGETVPEYIDEPYVQLNQNAPSFTDDELKTNSYEHYSELDGLGRCGMAEACVGIDLIPTEERGEIGDIKPSGWHTVKYEGVVTDGYLYNRCHLIDYQLTGNNSDVRNFITGTEYMNITGMLPFENMVARYVEMTGNHVMYRVTPYYMEDNLIATGVQIEACSVEDEGMGVYYNVFVYNVQPGVVIDYKTGDSWLE
ncbi:MAG: DNA/RNA non-specific endonuclease [Lachnospiraceae bacterium]|nr:DNA/RNA non-specific endonuclease [Lachnospiraceae bacterium]